MKTKSKPSKQTNPITIPSKVDAQAMFVKSLPKDIQARTHQIKDFIFATNMLLDNERPFTAKDFILITKGTDIDTSELMDLFNRWSKELCALGRLRETPTCYDEKLFSVV